MQYNRNHICWLDDVNNFYKGFAEVKLNDKWIFIDKNLNFYDINTNKPIKSQLNNENIDKVGKILHEYVNNYLKRQV